MYSNNESPTRGADENGASEAHFFERKHKVFRSRGGRLSEFDCIGNYGCFCASESFEDLSKYAWEGVVVLTHGSLLQFGCLSFVFSIVNGF